MANCCERTIMHVLMMCIYIVDFTSFCMYVHGGLYTMYAGPVIYSCTYVYKCFVLTFMQVNTSPRN